jgi:Biotin-lipoyl like
MLVFVVAVPAASPSLGERPVRNTADAGPSKKTGAAPRTRSGRGYVRAPHPSSVRSRTARLARVFVHPGDRVKRGQLLARTDDPGLRRRVRSAETALERAALTRLGEQHPRRSPRSRSERPRPRKGIPFQGTVETRVGQDGQRAHVALGSAETGVGPGGQSGHSCQDRAEGRRRCGLVRRRAGIAGHNPRGEHDLPRRTDRSGSRGRRDVGRARRAPSGEYMPESRRGHRATRSGGRNSRRGEPGPPELWLGREQRRDLADGPRRAAGQGQLRRPRGGKYPARPAGRGDRLRFARGEATRTRRLRQPAPEDR